MAGLAQFVQRLVDAKVLGDLWVDGSFLTEKIDPIDVDVVVAVDGDAVYDRGSVEQRAALDWAIGNQKTTLKCDSYVLMEYPLGHRLYDEGRWNYSYWHRQWGFDRRDDPKGIVVISLGAP